MNKKILSIFLIYFIQFIATSCVPPCDCDPIKTFERMYYGLELKAWDTSGFQNEEVTDSAYKNAFGLTISVQFDLNQISFSKPVIDLNSLGFASAYAFSDCNCPSDEYINLDPIESIEITVLNIENQEITIITDNFTTYGYNGEELTISELFEIRADWHDGFQVDMTAYDNVPNSAIFTVKIFLESGTELIEQTQSINFE
ncbi:hypothetical protein [Winogradskyella sp. R77965]|uniref:hypothetical protein n=1 Tax=Winogradskyella sp. R77965 TaxID=3093872 RepID=UPI0037DDA99F